MFATQAASSWRPDQNACKLTDLLDTRPPRTENAPLDFPTTRSILDRAEDWVQQFGKTLRSPSQVPVLNSFRWEHPDKDAGSAQVAKAVRAISGLRAALHLADSGYTVEAGTLLRTVADFTAEIEYLGEALIEGRLTADQQKFVEQHFAPFPEDPDELAAREREYYIGRKDVAKASRRLFEKWGGKPEEYDKIAAYLHKGYDSFVHGANESAMQLFTGRTRTFMLRGHESQRHICMTKVAVAGKLKAFLNALRLMAMSRNDQTMHDAIRTAFNELDKSEEDSGAPCGGLT